MLRATTLYAATAATAAAYYTQRLTAPAGTKPGTWCGRQAARLGITGIVHTAELESMLTGRHPRTGARLGTDLVDRPRADGDTIKAVGGFDLTVSAPKSVSVWWALTGDRRFLDAHQLAVDAALAHLERYGSTTRLRRDGVRHHPDTNGLTIATFVQTRSGADDPQLHTRAVISTKVCTDDGRWMALDASYLKQHQHLLGSIYQTVLRNEVCHRLGLAWQSLVNGLAEIDGVPTVLLASFSKRATAIDAELAVMIDRYRQHHDADPSERRRGALTRLAACDTRRPTSRRSDAELIQRWRAEAAALGYNADSLRGATATTARNAELRSARPPTMGQIVESVAAQRSAWTRADVLRTLCDTTPPTATPGLHSLDLIEQSRRPHHRPLRRSRPGRRHPPAGIRRPIGAHPAHHPSLYLNLTERGC